MEGRLEGKIEARRKGRLEARLEGWLEGGVEVNLEKRLEGMYVCAPEQMMSGSGSDPVELRLFGADCDNDAQCTTQACITHQGSRWCSMRCMQDDECPLSYVCGMVSGGRACVPPQ